MVGSRMHGFRVRAGVPDADGDPAIRQAADKVQRAFLFWSHGDHAHDAGIGTRVSRPVFFIGQHEILLELRAGLAFLKERRFHVRAQHDGSVRLRAVHHGLDALESGLRILRAGAHGGGQERSYAELFELAAHVAHGFLSVHGILAHEGMDVHIHKARQQQVALEIDGFRALNHQPLTDGGDCSLADDNVRTLTKCSVDKGFCVFDKHEALPFRNGSHWFLKAV